MLVKDKMGDEAGWNRKKMRPPHRSDNISANQMGSYGTRLLRGRNNQISVSPCSASGSSLPGKLMWILKVLVSGDCQLTALPIVESKFFLERKPETATVVSSRTKL